MKIINDDNDNARLTREFIRAMTSCGKKISWQMSSHLAKILLFRSDSRLVKSFCHFIMNYLIPLLKRKHLQQRLFHGHRHQFLKMWHKQLERSQDNWLKLIFETINNKICKHRIIKLFFKVWKHLDRTS